MENMSIDCVHTLGFLMRHVKPENTILDIGCGTGEVGYFLERTGYDSVHNIDILDLREFETKRFELYNGVNIPFEDCWFDIVILSFVLHHVPNEKKRLLLEEAVRVTKGKLFILEDTPRNPIDRLFSYLHGTGYRRKIKSNEWFGFYRQKRWEQIFRELGPKILVSQKLSRFCRHKGAPFARSFFLLEKSEPLTQIPEN